MLATHLNKIRKKLKYLKLSVTFHNSNVFEIKAIKFDRLHNNY